MGGTLYNNVSYRSFSKLASSMNTDDIFTSNKTRRVHDDMDPRKVKFREARDSAVHPNSLAILLGLDVTGSMRKIPEKLVKKKLGTIIETLMNHNVADPAVCFCAIGDSHPQYGRKMTDSEPCQIGQFESGDVELVKCLTSAWLEGGGGGQSMESYPLLYFVGSRMTSIDCFEKRGQKGFLFTVGDESYHSILTGVELKELFPMVITETPADIAVEDIYQEVLRKYHVFHIHCNDGSYRDSPVVLDAWRKLLKQNLIILDDSDLVAEVIASTIAVTMGVDKSSVLNSVATDSKSLTVLNSALANVAPGSVMNIVDDVVAL